MCLNPHYSVFSYDNPFSLLVSYHQLNSLVKSQFNCCFYICNTVEINSLTVGFMLLSFVFVYLLCLSSSCVLFVQCCPCPWIIHFWLSKHSYIHHDKTIFLFITWTLVLMSWFKLKYYFYMALSNGQSSKPYLAMSTYLNASIKVRLHGQFVPSNSL